MPEPLLLLAALVAAGVVVLAPLFRAPRAADPDDRESVALRHRVALEALRDVEADRRSGSLDEADYRAQLAEAEARAARTRRELAEPAIPPAASRIGSARTAGLVAAIAVAAALLIGAAIPATGIGNRTERNERLAAAQAAEAERQSRIAELRDALADDPRDTDALSDLADAHLAGSSADDLVRAAVALQLLIALEPERADAYERIMTAYLRAGDHANAREAHRAYVEVDTADPAELAFFDGLIALRGEGDAAAAREAFDRFLSLAPDDPRAGMVRGLRDEAAGGG